MGDATLMGFCSACGGSIDAAWSEGVDYFYLGAPGPEMIHTGCLWPRIRMRRSCC